MHQQYLTYALNVIPQLLSRVDYDIYSPTYGCFDRLYWGWKLKDFPDATLQRAVYPLALLWQQDETKYYQSDFFKRIVKAGIKYWANIQHNNGSFDQAFPNEYSYGASAFTLFPILQAYQIITDSFDLNERKLLDLKILRCADFLLHEEESHGTISNHLAGAALSLLSVSQRYGEAKYAHKANQLLDRIFSCQSPEGWYLEYEGFDAGYQTLASSYLAQCWRITKSSQLIQSLDRSIQFLSHFIHPDGTLGGEYCSRNTEIFYPAGFEILRNEIPLAAKISDTMLDNMKSIKSVPLLGLDTGNLIPLLSNYMVAYTQKTNSEQNKQSKTELPFQEAKLEKFYPHANLYIKNNRNYYTLVGISKGGVIKIYDKVNKRWLYNDCGYIGKLSKGHIISTQIFTNNPQVINAGNRLEINTSFYKVLSDIPTPPKFLLLRLLNLTVMRNLKLGNWIKQRLVKLLISSKKSYPVRLTRSIVLEDKNIIIKDILTKSKKISFEWLQFGRPFTTVHMASSKYYQETKLADPKAKSIDVKKFNQANLIESITTINFE